MKLALFDRLKRRSPRGLRRWFSAFLQDADADDVRERADGFGNLGADGGVGVNDRVGQLAARGVDHVGDVDVLAADEIEEAVEHARDVPVDDADAGRAHAIERHGGHVDGVFDVA